MIELWVFVSGGAEVREQRDLAVDVIRAVERIFVFELNVDLVLRNWDYRDEPPELVGLDQFAARSLRMVDRSHAVMAILGPTVPRVTGQEIRRAVERFTAGQTDRVWVFVDEAMKNDKHRRFVQRIAHDLSVQVVYQPFTTPLDLQRKLFVALTPLVIRKTILATPAPTGVAGI